MPDESGAQAPVAPATPAAPQAAVQPKPPISSHNQRLTNKFAVGDEVWAVVSLGPDLKVGKYTIKGMNAELLEGGKWEYMYHIPVGEDGHADGVNLTVAPERLMSHSREDAEKYAQSAVNDIYKEYDIKIAEVTKEFEKQMEESQNRFDRTIAQYMEEKEKCNADDLVIQPREVKPEKKAETAVAELIGGAPTDQNKPQVEEEEALCSHGEPLENCKEEHKDEPVSGCTPKCPKTDHTHEKCDACAGLEGVDHADDCAKLNCHCPIDGGAHYASCSKATHTPPPESNPQTGCEACDGVALAPHNDNCDEADPDADCLICSMKAKDCACSDEPNPPTNEPENQGQEAGATKDGSQKDQGQEAGGSDGSPSKDSEQPA